MKLSAKTAKVGFQFVEEIGDAIITFQVMKVEQTKSETRVILGIVSDRYPLTPVIQRTI